MNKVHGVFKSFSEMGLAMGMKPKSKSNKPIKCPKCGQSMRRCGNSNVHVCDLALLEEKAMANGTPVQVFTRCETVFIAEV